ncbi:hypothetical protein JZ751_005184, partial [Albula glossodonta]
KVEEEDEDEEEVDKDVDEFEEEIEAVLLEEFPPEEEDNVEEEETEARAEERLELEIGDRFETDDNNLQRTMDLLADHQIPRISVSGGRKPRVVHYQMHERLKALVEDRESLFQKCQTLSYSLARKLLQLSYKYYSAFGCWDPVKYSEGDLIQPIQGPTKPSFPVLFNQFVLDGYPMTKKQADLMETHSVMPVRLIELQLDTIDVLKRGLADKMKMTRPYPLHDSSQILNIRNSSYKQEVAEVRQHFQQKYQNWVSVDGLRSKWWVWSKVLDECRISLRCIHTYLEQVRSGQAASIDRLCITPKELHSRLGEFGQYCPVSLALHQQLVDCSHSASLQLAAEFQGRYYKMASKEFLESLTGLQVKSRFPQQVEMKGYCPVTFLDGQQRYEALVHGKPDYAAEYREKIYIFENKEKQQKFLRSSDYTRKRYKKELEKFEESCELIAYLGSTMAQTCSEPEEQPIDIDQKLHKFLALRSIEADSAGLSDK